MGRKVLAKIGDKNGDLTLINIFKGKSGISPLVEYSCACGKKQKRTLAMFKKSNSCGCKRRFWNDLTGKVLKNLKIIKNLEIDAKNHQGLMYLCECVNCGNQYKNATTQLTNMKVGCKCEKIYNETAPKNKIFCQYRKNAQIKGLDFKLELSEFINLCEKSCHYCGLESSNEVNIRDFYYGWKYNGIDRVDNKKGYILENCVTCYKTCNKMKMALLQTEFLNHITRIYNKSILTNKFGYAAEVLIK
jgi:hypothetical protein